HARERLIGHRRVCADLVSHIEVFVGQDRDRGGRATAVLDQGATEQARRPTHAHFSQVACGHPHAETVDTLDPRIRVRGCVCTTCRALDRGCRGQGCCQSRLTFGGGGCARAHLASVPAHPCADLV